MSSLQTLSLISRNLSSKTKWYWRLFRSGFDEEGWDLPEISVRADAAALNFRKKMAALVEEERGRLAPKALQSA